MSSYERRLATATVVRLAALIQGEVNLNLQLIELKRLRERVRQAQLSARKSRRTGHRKKAHFDELSTPRER
jgi:hypothetical protein